jgi:hypothetical protein
MKVLQSVRTARPIHLNHTRKSPFVFDSFYVTQDSTFPIEFIGGSQDGEVIEGTAAPDFFDVVVTDGVKEVYERQNDEPPFIYVQIGYAVNETWK